MEVNQNQVHNQAQTNREFERTANQSNEDVQANVVSNSQVTTEYVNQSFNDLPPSYNALFNK